MISGRVFRKVDTGWQPIGDELPSFDHLPPRPNDPIAAWVLPIGVRYQAGDVIVIAETGHRLLAPIPPGDDAWAAVIAASSALHDETAVAEFVASIELWLCMRIDGDWR